MIPSVQLLLIDRQSIADRSSLSTINADGAISAIVTIGVPQLSPMDHFWHQWRLFHHWSPLASLAIMALLVVIGTVCLIKWWSWPSHRHNMVPLAPLDHHWRHFSPMATCPILSDTFAIYLCTIPHQKLLETGKYISYDTRYLYHENDVHCSLLPTFILLYLFIIIIYLWLSLLSYYIYSRNLGNIFNFPYRRKYFSCLFVLPGNLSYFIIVLGGLIVIGKLFRQNRKTVKRTTSRMEVMAFY
jgi:hypothetical protein